MGFRWLRLVVGLCNMRLVGWIRVFVLCLAFGGCVWWMCGFWFAVLVVRCCMMYSLCSCLVGWVLHLIWFGCFGWRLGCYSDLMFLDWLICGLLLWYRF